MLQKLKHRNPQTRQTGLESQFYLLSQVTPDPDDVDLYCNTARAHQNKNRFDKFLPRKNYC